MLQRRRSGEFARGEVRMHVGASAAAGGRSARGSACARGEGRGNGRGKVSGRRKVGKVGRRKVKKKGDLISALHLLRWRADSFIAQGCCAINSTAALYIYIYIYLFI